MAKGSKLCAIVLSVLWGLSVSAFADNVSVGCPGGTPGDYASLDAALAAVSHNNDTISVSGTCTELVGVYNFNNLTIVGAAGATIAEPAAVNPQGDVLDIGNSQNVVIQGMRIQAVPHTEDTAITVVGVNNSSITLRDSVVEGGGWTDGLDIFPTSLVSLTGGTVVENNADGVGVYANGSGSSVDVSRGPGPGCPVIQDNGDGLVADNNASISVRQCATISGSSNTVGIASQNGGTVDVRNPQATPGSIQIINNVAGVAAVQGSRLVVRGPVLIQGNSLDGIRLRTSSVGEIGPSGGGTAGPNITQNGAGGFQCCAVPAGISAAVNSSLEINAVSIYNNPAAGIHLTDNSSARLFNHSFINGNQGGMVLQNSSTALLYFAPSISGNSGSDLSCTADSRAYGDSTAIGKLNCSGFQAQSNPAMGSKGKIIP